MTATLPGPAIQALAAPRRREILRLVWEGERSAGEIHAAMGDVTFGAVSQHLRVLADAELVTRRRAGRRRYYQARRAALGPLRAWLEAMWDDALYQLKLRAELEEARRGPAPRSGKDPAPRSGGDPAPRRRKKARPRRARDDDARRRGRSRP